jgi:tetratricopeptide (TPR) repeat protein
MATSEIEKLERRYAENPHGLTFAPLAEVHRKNGDFTRALELLTAGLELHPNYIPASIVLGRCHQDTGDLPAAEAAFSHVLRLDEENVIALKSLADIDERLERYAEAEGWLRRLVSVDRSNDDAKEQLRRVEAARESKTATPVEKPSDEQVAEPPTPAAPVLEMIDLSPEPMVQSEEPPGSTPELLPVDIAALEPAPEGRPAREPDLAPAAMQSEAASAPQAEAEPGEASAPPPTEAAAPEPEEEVQPLPGLISAEFEPPLQATGGLGVETSEDVVLEVSADSEYSVPDASEDFKSLAARLSARREPAAEPSKAAPTPREPTRKAPDEPEFVFTETMAEVLAEQGHSADALRVYRELARKNGGDSRLESRIRELEAALAVEPPKRQSYLARDTNGQSVATFFRALLAARLSPEPGSADRAHGGSPGSSYGGESVPVPPAVPSAEPKSEAGVSFDDFFSAEPKGSAPLRQGKSEPGKDDLDQFQSWLQNLKR